MSTAHASIRTLIAPAPATGAPVAGAKIDAKSIAAAAPGHTDFRSVLLAQNSPHASALAQKPITAAGFAIAAPQIRAAAQPAIGARQPAVSAAAVAGAMQVQSVAGKVGKATPKSVGPGSAAPSEIAAMVAPPAPAIQTQRHSPALPVVPPGFAPAAPGTSAPTVPVKASLSATPIDNSYGASEESSSLTGGPAQLAPLTTAASVANAAPQIELPDAPVKVGGMPAPATSARFAPTVAPATSRTAAPSDNARQVTPQRGEKGASLGQPANGNAPPGNQAGATNDPESTDPGATDTSSDDDAPGAASMTDGASGKVLAGLAATNTQAPPKELTSGAAMDSPVGHTVVQSKTAAATDDTDAADAPFAAPDNASANLDASVATVAQAVAHAAPAAMDAASNTSAATPASQVAHAVAAVHVAAGSQGQLSIHLNPGDLGTVQVTIARAPDGAATVTVQVEKAETLQSMQQDITHLHQALDRAGVPVEARQINMHLVVPAATASADSGTSTGGQMQGGQGGFGSGAAPGNGQRGGQPQSQHGGPGTPAPPAFANDTDPAVALRWRAAGINITA